MRRRLRTLLTALAPACVLVLAAQSSAQAQGRAGVDRAMGRTTDVSLGRGNGSPHVRHPDTSSPTPRRTPYEYADQARIRENNRRQADKELRDHPEMPARLNTTADALREGYREALFYNLFLTFDQYLASMRLAANLGPARRNVTREAILNGLAAGKSVGRTLRDLGLSKEEAKEAERRAKSEIKESKRRG